MNERTKDVNPHVYSAWQQAAATVSPLKTGGEWQKDFVIKFAELIALDCMKLCTEVKEDLFTIQDNDKRDLAEMAATFCYEAIKSEFGVEE